MGGWNAMSYEGRDTLLDVLRSQAEQMFSRAERPETWDSPTACPGWQVRDVVGHLVDMTERNFAEFDAARGHRAADPAYGVRRMAELVNERAIAFRPVGQAELLQRLRTDFAKLTGTVAALGPDEWAGLNVPLTYMGPRPAFLIPAMQLMDYTLHGWDIVQGAGRAHGISGEAADLLVPFMFGLWQMTASTGPDTEPYALGIRVTSGHNAGDIRAQVGPAGLAWERGDVSGLPTIIEFDPGSLVLTAFGRVNAGTVRGDIRIADRFLNLFFRI